MSPGQLFHDINQQGRKEITGPRPSPLKIHKDSHLIQKSSSSFFNGVITTAAGTKHHQKQQQNQQSHHHHPVIIYTHSPKIIHTQARDFMALVQKLTGLSRSEDRPAQPPQSHKENNKNTRPSAVAAAHEDTESSSVVTDENCGGGGGGGRGDNGVNSFSVSPLVMEQQPNPFFSDVPLFTPNSIDFFCSPRPPFHTYLDSVFTPSYLRSSISPSVLKVMKGFQEY